MSLAERISKAFHNDAPELRGVKHALDYLGPKFGVYDGGLTVRRGDWSRCWAYRSWKDIDGKPVVLERKYVITIAPGASRADYGEETGHYLHAMANPAFSDTVHFELAPKTAPEAFEYLALRNWEECLGKYAGLVYARYWGEPTRRTEDEYAGNFDVLAGRAYSDDTGLWSVLTHMAGYCAADELYARDPWGSGLARFARLPAKDSRSAMTETTGWRKYWPLVEGVQREEAVRLTRKYVPGA